MIRNVLQEIGGIGLYGVISICLFVTVFTGALIRVALLRKNALTTMSRIPLEDGELKGADRHE